MRNGWMRIGLLAACPMIVISCGAGGRTDGSDPLDLLDTTTEPGWDASSARPDAGGQQDNGFVRDGSGIEDTVGWDQADTADLGSEPALCGAKEACNALLHKDGSCPGRCIPQPHTMTCQGTVHHGLCYRLPPPDQSVKPAQFGSILVTPVAWPRVAVSGETHVIRVSVRNVGATPLVLPFSYKHPDTWEVLSASFVGLSALALDATEETVLEAQMLAVRPDVLDPYGGLMLTLDFAGDRYELFSRIVFGPEEPIECGGYFFPAQWCPDGVCGQMGRFYTSARCCGDVFFPGAMCCGDADCLGGSCVDGRCLADVPTLGSANTVPVGNQRILLVLSDFEFAPAGSLCVDRVDEMRKVYPFEEATAYIEEVVQRRLLRDLVDFRWTVLAGLSSDHFIVDGNYLFPNFLDRLEEYLASQGCETFDRFDKVIVASPRMDLQGWGGHALDRGRIAVGSPANPLLLAHELAHTFGATDLYFDLGGQFQYLPALMANNTDFNMGGLGPPGDDVMWGEMGLDDVDRDNVVDLVEFAAFPESLEVVALSASLTHKESLEVAIEFGGREGGVPKRVVLPRFRLEIPGLGVARDVFDPYQVKFVVFDQYEVDLATLESWQDLDVRVVASLSFTTKDWGRKTLVLDRLFTVPLGRAQPADGGGGQGTNP